VKETKKEKKEKQKQKQEAKANNEEAVKGPMDPSPLKNKLLSS